MKDTRSAWVPLLLSFNLYVFWSMSVLRMVTLDNHKVSYLEPFPNMFGNLPCQSVP